VQPFLFGHKLQFLIEKRVFFGFNGEPGEVSTRISAGSPVSGHLTTFLERKSFPIGINTSRLPMANQAISLMIPWFIRRANWASAKGLVQAPA
jgi:hypothetical protein